MERQQCHKNKHKYYLTFRKSNSSKIYTYMWVHKMVREKSENLWVKKWGKVKCTRAHGIKIEENFYSKK